VALGAVSSNLINKLNFWETGWIPLLATLELEEPDPFVLR